jgi:hypothetical protein
MAYLDPSGFYYNEYYLYSLKQWEVVPSGIGIYDMVSGVSQNAPIIVTASGFQTSTPGDPWGQTNGLGKYNKVGYGYFTKNGDGSLDTGKNEFALDPSASGRLVFNKTLKDILFLEYEASPSGYYIYNTVDLNPVRNQIDSGFIHCSVNTDPAFISLTCVHPVLPADGLHFTRLTATLLDANYDRVPNKNITFSIPDDFLGQLTPINGTAIAAGPSGHTIKTRSLSDSRGRAKVIYTPILGQSGTQLLKAESSDNSKIYSYATVLQSYVVANPFILDSSLLDSLDYLS